MKRGKNDARDAEAICEAVGRPTMSFVVKSLDQQAALMLHKARDLLLKQRTMLVNAIRDARPSSAAGRRSWGRSRRSWRESRPRKTIPALARDVVC